jgi:hypothetical protein
VWFYLQIGRKIEPTSGLEPLTPAPATSLLACVLARPDASGNCACWGCSTIRQSHFVHCVPARLQYGLRYMRGRQFVLGMKLLMSARG